MGLFRFFLAYVVLVSHCSPGILPKYLHPALAVQCFYLISGFYIQLIIRENYISQKDWKWDFYKSRILRIFPTYYIFMIPSFFMLKTNNLSFMIDEGYYGSAIMYLANNLFIFGQDIIRFFVYDVVNGNFVFTFNNPDLDSVKNRISLTVMWQSWTLALELSFYVIAPFVLRLKAPKILAIILISIVLRVILGNEYNLYEHGWIYGFFPSEIGIFLLGSLSYRVYRYAFMEKKLEHFLNWLSEYISKNKLSAAKITKALSFLLWITLLWYCIKGWRTVNFGGGWSEAPTGVPYSYWSVIFLTFIIAPWMFNLTKNWKLDRFIGELSYPLYLSHSLVIWILKDWEVNDYYQGLYVLIISVLVSIPVVLFVDQPITKLRHKLFYKD